MKTYKLVKNLNAYRLETEDVICTWGVSKFLGETPSQINVDISTTPMRNASIIYVRLINGYPYACGESQHQWLYGFDKTKRIRNFMHYHARELLTDIFPSAKVSTTYPLWFRITPA